MRQKQRFCQSMRSMESFAFGGMEKRNPFELKTLRLVVSPKQHGGLRLGRSSKCFVEYIFYHFCGYELIPHPQPPPRSSRACSDVPHVIRKCYSSSDMQRQFFYYLRILAVTYGVLIVLWVNFWLLTPAQTVSGCPTFLYSKLSRITPLLLAVRVLFGWRRDS